jgi:hypothetical protein
MEDWQDQALRPGLTRIDRWYGGTMLAAVILWAVCCFSYTHHWVDVGIASSTCLAFLTIGSALRAGQLAKDEHVRWMRSIQKMEE